jgi:pre-mRNA 3'-end-processing factor FIP1
MFLSPSVDYLSNLAARQARYNEIRNVPQRTSANDTTPAAAPVKKETKESKIVPSGSGADLPGIATSKIDVNAKPIYEPAGKPITQVIIDAGRLQGSYSICQKPV